MSRVLIVTPHFPPDTGAASHRMRLLAPRLPEHGWEPTIVAVDPRDIGARIEPDLAHFVHGPLRVERVRAWGATRGRFLGVGDLGLRALIPLERRCRELLERERYDALLVTLPPHYGALLGPRLGRIAKVPYLLDYQDPWVSAWGATVGGGAHGALDWKSRLSRWLALRLEPRALRCVAGLIAVSAGTLTDLFQRHPELRDVPRGEVPLGGEPRDFVLARASPRANRFFDPRDGLVHVVYVGTLLPLGRTVLRAVFEGVVLLRQQDPERFARLRFHFFGTSNRTTGDVPLEAMPLACAMGIERAIEEHPLRVDYLDALTLQAQAAAILLVGSTEPHYTASKIYPALLAGRPVVAVYHEASTVCDAIRRYGPDGGTHLVTFDSGTGLEAVSASLSQALTTIVDGHAPISDSERLPDLGPWSASALAGRMAACLSAAVVYSRERAATRA